MKLSTGILAIATLALAVMSARAEDSTTELTSPPQPGRFRLTIKSGGFNRTAHVHIPAGFTPGAKPALVLMLHGAGGEGNGALDHDGWAAKADKEGFLAVAPDGLPVKPSTPSSFFTNPRVWNTGQMKASSPRAAIDDVAFVKQLLDELQKRIPFDEHRVFCAGHSNGAGMTFRLAAELPERFAAIGVMAGVLQLANPQPKKPLPTLGILGTQDPLLPIAGGEIKLPWGKRQNPPVAEPLAAWAKALGCAAEPVTLSDNDHVKKVEYPSKAHGPALTVLYLEGHGHQWPGGDRTLPESMIGPITSKLNATDVLWEFFVASIPGSAK